MTVDGQHEVWEEAVSWPDGVMLRQRFIDAMSHAACTVNVVTTDGPAGRFGTTVSAMSSVSADTDPPTLLVCINEQSASAAPMLENGAFCVNVLRDDQSAISDCFAGRVRMASGDKFSCTTWTTGATGAPRVAGALVAFDCRILSTQKIGSHYVLLGAVVDIAFDKPGSPLIYANRAYGTTLRLDVPPPAVEPGDTEPLGIGVFHTFGPYVVPEVLGRLARRGRRIRPRLVEGDQDRVVKALKSGEVELALIYEWDLGEQVVTERLTGLKPHVLFSAADRLADQPAVSLADLVDKPLVLLDARPSAAYFLSLFAQQDLVPTVAYRTSSFEMVRGIVGQNLGYSILVAKPATNMSYDGRPLCTRPLSDGVATSFLAMARLEQTDWSPAATDFAHHCRQMFSEG